MRNIKEMDKRLDEREQEIERLQQENKQLKEDKKKAIELLNELLSSTKGVLNDYSYHKEHNKILIELLREDEQVYIKLLEILGDKE